MVNCQTAPRTSRMRKTIKAPKSTKSSSANVTAAAPEMEEQFELTILDLRKALSESMAKMHEANKDTRIAREYGKVLENRRLVAEKMADEVGDETYAKFEGKFWIDLRNYVNSERSPSDKLALAEALTGNTLYNHTKYKDKSIY